MSELARHPAKVVRAVRAGELVVLSKHKRAVAMIVPLLDEYNLTALDLSRVEALAALAATFEERRADRSASAFMHGRLFGRRYPYRRGPRRR